jgi:MFS family permease
MASTPKINGATAGRSERFATRLAFFSAGSGIAAWAPLVPFVKARAGLDAGMLGLLLLCLGTGSIIAMPLSGALVARFGCRRVLIVSGGMICLSLPLLAVLSNIALLVSAMMLFGAGIGSADCAANTQAIIVERVAGRPMMSGFHGLYSVGGILSAAGVSAMLSVGLTPLLASLVVDAGIALALFFASPGLLAGGSERGGRFFAVPHGVVLFIGILCFVVFMTEGAALDWSAVFLIQVRGVAPSHAGLAYTAFVCTMTVGRLTGDAIVRRVGRSNIILFGGICAAAGLALATLIPFWQAALLGYALVGAGCSNIAPVLYTAIARQKTMPESVAIPAVTTIGYAGILAGPAVIGGVAEVTSLSVAFLALAGLLLGVAASGRLLRV